MTIKNTQPSPPVHTSRIKILISLFLVAVTLAVYLQVKDFSFVNYDDDDYVYRNHAIMKDFNTESVSWAFTATRASNWHPLTWISHMIDYQLYRLNPGAHHLTSVFFTYCQCSASVCHSQPSDKMFMEKRIYCCYFCSSPSSC